LCVEIDLKQLGLRRPKRIILLSLWLIILGFAIVAQDTPSDASALATVLGGVLPIILAAPHGGRQAVPGVLARRGVGVARFSTKRDHNTGDLAEKIAGKLENVLGRRPFLVVARFERKYIDANRSDEDAYESSAARPYYVAYHGAIEAACDRVRKEWGRGLLLDLHGQGAEVGAIFRGTYNGKSVTALTRRFGSQALDGAKSILGYLNGKGYKIIPDLAGGERELRYTGGYTTRIYGSHRGTGIDAIQLELGKTLRCQARLNQTAADIAEAIAIFARAYLPVEGGSDREQRI